MIRRLLTLVSLAGIGSVVLALTAGQALASHVQCGDVITQDTTLDSDLTCPVGPIDPSTGQSYPALSISADGVVLDLAGHTVRQEGEASSSRAIQIAAADHCPDDVAVRDGFVDGDVNIDPCSYRVLLRHLTFADGSELSGRNNGPAIVEHSKFVGVDGRGGISIWGTAVIRNNVFEGGNQIWIRGGGLPGELPGPSIADNVISDMYRGIYLFKGGGEIARNRISGSADSAIQVVVAGASIHDNVISRNNTGIRLGYGSAYIEHNVINHNLADGIHVGDASSATIEENGVSANGRNGIWAGAYPTGPLTSAQVIGNRVTGNALDGIHMDQCLQHDPLVQGNTSDRNGDDGIEVVHDLRACYDDSRPTTPTTVTGNHTWWNGDLGIEAVLGTPGGGNWAKHNSNPLQCVPASLCSTKGKPRG
jgi:hypothetical protein